MTVATYPQETASTTWTIGIYDGDAGYGGYRGIAGTDVKWRIETIPLPLQPGTYTMTNIKAVISLASDAQADLVYCGILQGDTDAVAFQTLGNGLTYVDCSASRENTQSTILFTHDISNVTFTIAAGQTYWLAVGIRAVNGHTTGHAGFKCMNENVGPQDLIWFGTVASWDGSLLTYNTAAATYELARMVLTFTTYNKKLYSVPYSAASKVCIPVRSDGDYWVQFNNAVVADGQALTCVFNADANADASARTTLVLDMGATDLVTFGGATINLAGAGAEAGDTFDLNVNVRPVTGKMDLFYQNKTTGQGPASAATDFAIISHACKNNAAADASRGQSYTIAKPSWLELSGTAAVDYVTIGCDPVVMFGDSNATRLSAQLPTAFTYDRMILSAMISGNELCTSTAQSTAGYLRYKATTPGQGDICEMTGAVFCFAGFGVNDISGGPDSAAERNMWIMLMATRTCEILDDLQDKGNTALLIGLPPWSDLDNANTHEAKSIKEQWNPVLEGIAIGCRAAYLNPWWDVVSSGTENDDVPVFNPSYCETGSLHYNTAGATLVSRLAAQSYESGIVGGPWTKRNTRGRRPGLLLPI